MNPVKIGVVGCGAISNAYFTHAKLYPELVQIVAVADLNKAAAKAKAAEHGIPQVMSVAKLIKDPAIEIVLNLTIPAAHAAVALKAIRAGKHTYSEKPLGISVAQGRKILAEAQKQGVRVGCAPDTFLGAGQQTARKLIDDGAIGRPLVATAFMMGRGVETWHPNPEFYYKPGGGPMLDMGPYYLTALLNMLGKIDTVRGSAGIMIPKRTITHKNRQTGENGPKYGQIIDVETPDHVAGTIDFASGAIGTIVTSFATAHATHDGKLPITIYGSEGTLRVPDPNGFDGTVQMRKLDDAEWTEVPHTHEKGFARMVGVVDLAQAIRTNRPHRASGQLAMAVLESMAGFLKSAQTGKVVRLSDGFERPLAMPTNLKPGQMD
ncbi:MAG: Gfo/Idh/MocA family oxidoreductase [Phycisphaeraceae bacterium]